jgi:Cu/Ag efflux protein CusF
MLVSTAICWSLHLAVVPGHAQSCFGGEGRVVALDGSEGIVTLDHGPIAGLMPAMQMAFPVQRAEQLVGLQAGALVRFSLQSRGTEWVITTIDKLQLRMEALCWVYNQAAAHRTARVCGEDLTVDGLHFAPEVLSWPLLPRSRNT